MSLAHSQYNYVPGITPVRVVSTANLSGLYINGPLNNGLGATLTASSVGALVVDGVTLIQDDRVLLVGQTSANQNGVYVVNQPGSASAVWVLTRSADQQNIEQLKKGQYVAVGAGTADGGSIYVLVEPLPSIFGISNIIYVPSSDPASGSFLISSNNLSDVANAATARTNLGAQSLANIHVQQFGYAGGSATVSIPDASITASNIVFVQLATSANAVTIQKANAGTGVIVVTCSGDPGVSGFNYLVFRTVQ